MANGAFYAVSLITTIILLVIFITEPINVFILTAMALFIVIVWYKSAFKRPSTHGTLPSSD